jgi:hypothetical protein
MSFYLILHTISKTLKLCITKPGEKTTRKNKIRCYLSDFQCKTVTDEGINDNTLMIGKTAFALINKSLQNNPIRI